MSNIEDRYVRKGLSFSLWKRNVAVSVLAMIAVVGIVTVSWSGGEVASTEAPQSPTEVEAVRTWIAEGAEVESWAQPGCHVMQPKSQHIVMNLQLFDGDKREFLLFLPGSSTLPPALSGSRPTFRGLAVVFHGVGHSCDLFFDFLKLGQYAEKYGVMVVAACGRNGDPGKGFNAGVCCLGRDEPDDVAFARAIVDAVSSYTCTDFRGRTMTFGFSNGGMMSQMLGCISSDVFSSVVSIAGVVAMRPGLQEGLRACDAAIARRAERPSVLMIHGDADEGIPWTGQNLTSIHGVARLPLPDVPSNAAAWAARNGCTNTTVMTINTLEFTNMRYEHCMPSSVRGDTRSVVVELVRHHGGGHGVPMAHDFHGITYALEFGLQHSWG